MDRPAVPSRKGADAACVLPNESSSYSESTACNRSWGSRGHDPRPKSGVVFSRWIFSRFGGHVGFSSKPLGSGRSGLLADLSLSQAGTRNTKQPRPVLAILRGLRASRVCSPVLQTPHLCFHSGCSNQTLCEIQ